MYTLKKTLKTLIITITVAMAAVCFSFAASSEYTPITVKLGNKLVSNDAWEFKGTPYIALDTLKGYGDCSSFTINEAASRIYFELSEMNLSIVDEETTDFIKTYGGTCYIYIKGIDKKPYVALNAISQFAKLGYEFNDNVVQLLPYKNAEGLASVTQDCTGVTSIINSGGETVNLKKGQVLFNVKELGFVSEAETIDGVVIYIASHRLKSVSEDELADFNYSAKTKKTYNNEKINLVWHNMSGTTLEPPEATGGIDIVAPTWCGQIVNGNGEVTNYCNRGYVDTCHKRGFDVWLTVSNNMTVKGSTDYTTKVLEDKQLRNKVIAQELFYAALYNIDGINVDYEELRDANRDSYTAFIDEYSKWANRMGLNFSVCIPPVAEWYIEYDYAALGSCCDFICMMSYDQNVSKAGSVASYTWVESSISTMCEYVDADKILMGMPFYTKIWTVSGGSYTSKNAGFESAKETIISWGVKPVWDSKCRQYYASSGSKSVWLEDARSIANKLTLVYKYDIKGSCCWSQGWSSAEIYDLIESVYKDGVDPDTITPAYI